MTVEARPELPGPLRREAPRAFPTRGTIFEANTRDRAQLGAFGARTDRSIGNMRDPNGPPLGSGKPVQWPNI